MPSAARRSRSALGLLWIGGLLGLPACSYDVTLGSVGSALAAQECGTWDSAGVHLSGTYFVGHSNGRPDDTLAYFVFDLSSAQGKAVTGATLTIPGTSDWQISVPAPDRMPLLQFKLGVTPLPASLSLSDVLTSDANPSVYSEVRDEQDLGFGWVDSGSVSKAFDAFYYAPERLQAAVDRGGAFAMFAVRRFGDDATTEEYLYGGGVCSPRVLLNLSLR